ncbi:MAG: hypothetical protein AB7K37_03585 [Cyclobacteriaceae bacterium]
MKVFIVVMLFSFAAPLCAEVVPVKEEQVKVLSTKSDIFYFKVSDRMLGGEIEIKASDGELLGSQSIAQKRNLIDFYSLEPGMYTVIISKDEIVKEFHYEKK